ncbi:hypothetical protein ABMA27_009435 [Loxostege sticticalis]|uniref:Uncharacterized protein n=1 Tax=Loxostege sticticalis TaxID=481309 RepID=A0ABR3H7X8_LOXSC
MFKFIVLTVVASAVAMPNQSTEAPAETVRVTNKKDCSSGIFSPTCLKLGVLTLMEKLNNKDEVALVPGVSLVKDRDAKTEAVDFARALSSEPEERLDKYLLYHVGSFLDTHSVKLRLLDESAVEEARSMIGEGRGKNPLGMGGKKGGMGGLIAMAMMMKGVAVVGLKGLKYGLIRVSQLNTQFLEHENPLLETFT